MSLVLVQRFCLPRNSVDTLLHKSCGMVEWALVEGPLYMEAEFHLHGVHMASLRMVDILRVIHKYHQ